MFTKIDYKIRIKKTKVNQLDELLVKRLKKKKHKPSTHVKGDKLIHLWASEIIEATNKSDYERVATIEVFRYKTHNDKWCYIATIDDGKGFSEGEVEFSPKMAVRKLIQYLVNDNLKVKK